MSASWLSLRFLFAHGLEATTLFVFTYPERGAIRHSDGEVREYGEEPVRGRRSESEVVGDLVDRQEEVLVGGRAEDVGDGPELP